MKGWLTRRDVIPTRIHNLKRNENTASVTVTWYTVGACAMLTQVGLEYSMGPGRHHRDSRAQS